ncbi:MAG: exodeoxyribonuclease VII small subunit [Bacteroidales bacterium]|nr:exodeoxyribonuclease VII small subunit [Bacteroidales bacterium]
MEKFDYKEAVATLEKILAKVEDPATGIDDIDKYVRQAEELTSRCREYLRSVREKVDAI